MAAIRRTASFRSATGNDRVGSKPAPVPYLRRVARVALPWLPPVALARSGGRHNSYCAAVAAGFKPAQFVSRLGFFADLNSDAVTYVTAPPHCPTFVVLPRNETFHHRSCGIDLKNGFL